MNPRVGQEIRKARLLAGLTLADVAAGMRVSTQYLSDVERGRRTYSSDRLAALVEIVRMPAAQRNKCFVMARMLPPALTSALLKNPHTWDDLTSQLRKRKHDRGNP